MLLFLTRRRQNVADSVRRPKGGVHGFNKQLVKNFSFIDDQKCQTKKSVKIYKSENNQTNVPIRQKDFKNNHKSVL